MDKKSSNIFFTEESMLNTLHGKFNLRVGLIDADLLDHGTRHPNLALLKIAGFLNDNNILFNLIKDSNESSEKYDIIFLSKVFSFTKLPIIYKRALNTQEETKFYVGGTGFYANVESINEFILKRSEDFESLEKNKFLSLFKNHCGGVNKMGINMARQKPYYRLYDEYIQCQKALGRKEHYYKDYQKYSIGFLTRGCVRHCPFCVNKLENNILPYSKIEWFIDNERDGNGRLIRPYIYLWDDNFLAAEYSIWKPLLLDLINTKRPFQFRQGLDERMLADSPYGEEMAQMLSQARYHGDFIFAFDNWKDREKIEKALKIWKKYNPKKGTKFYLFCGFKQRKNDLQKLYKDIYELFQRIRILMQYGCVGYVMRHEDYKEAPLANIYVQIARWCNQQQFYKKMSFWEYTYRNQTYWEEQAGFEVSVKIKSYEEFLKDYSSGYYTKEDSRGQRRKICKTLQTFIDLLNLFEDHRDELLEMFNYKMSVLRDPKLWENQ